MLYLSYRTEDENKIRYFILFTGFEIDKAEKYVEVSVNPNVEYIINGLRAEFNKSEWSAFTSIRSTGYYVVRIEDFRELLDIPKSYLMSNIDQNFLCITG